jgi:hypothetical protein
MKDYILVKLRSGEEIIATLVSKNRNGIKVMRPMQIKQIPFMDHYSGVLKAAVVMENWIGRTSDDQVTIPNNWIGIKMPPSKDTIDAYEKHMNSEDTDPPKKEIAKTIDVSKPSSETEDELKRLEKEMSDALMDIMGLSGGSSESDSPFNMPKSQGDNKEVVVVNFMFPSKLFKSMMEEGLFEDLIAAGTDFQNIDEMDDEDMEDDVDDRPKTKKSAMKEDFDSRDSGESGKESWGNSYKDWSPDPRDYL